jgi:menaquinone-dependent protoporphyrinogen oxidase
MSDKLLVAYATRYGSTKEVAEEIAAARRFLSRNRTALERVPVAVFALGPTEDKEKDWQETRGQLDKVLAGFPWLTPVAVELFGGKFDPARLTFPYTLIPALKKMPVSDIRDWDAIRAWARGLGRKLIR